MIDTVSTFYVEGIKEGRASLERHGMAAASDELANLNSTIKGFPASTSVGQLLRGERDFWANQIKRARKTERA
ncbi:hypothetical protein [Acidovorax sp. PRC11]|uniref:hypothetical protein n=1 Tax=Acidovorax sp. PRC11 TaxID=2962592 RepID=UPI0028814D35|nr:hypothetical protein [Acidovorax sp. PRC11]MDT0140186.1 hypothetical protein [Acidovorax sp. PRC11]